MKFNFSIWFSVCILGYASLAHGDTSRFEGHWIDPESRGTYCLPST